MKTVSKLVEALLAEEYVVMVHWADTGWGKMGKIEDVGDAHQGKLKYQNSANPKSQEAKFAFPSPEEASAFMNDLKKKVPSVTVSKG
jgi:hypothetical protein